MVSENTLGRRHSSFSYSKQTNEAQGHTKKVLTNAILLVGSTTGSLTGPQITKNDSSYNKVKIVMMVCPAATFFILCAMRLLNVTENRKRDHLAQGREAAVSHQEFLDLTDHENLQFRYAMVN